jgi:hypothetical protein
MIWKAIDFTLNLIPVLSTLKIWVQKLFNVKLVAFLVLKGILFFLFYKYLPLLFGRFVSWIAALSSDTVDLTYLSSVLLKPDLTGLAAWIFLTLKLDVCIKLLITGATLRLGLKRVPFMSN